MFPASSYNLVIRPANPNEATISDLTGSSDLLVPGRVTTTTIIPQGAMSMPIEASTLKGTPDIVQVSSIFH